MKNTLHTADDVSKFLSKNKIPYSNIATSLLTILYKKGKPFSPHQYPLLQYGGSCALTAYFYKELLEEKLSKNDAVFVKNVIEREPAKKGLLGHHSNLIRINSIYYDFDHHLYPENILPIDGGNIKRANYKNEENPQLKSSFDTNTQIYIVNDGKREFHYHLTKNHTETFVENPESNIVYENRYERIKIKNPFIFQGSVNGIRMTLSIKPDDIIQDTENNPYALLSLKTNTETLLPHHQNFEKTLQIFLDSFVSPITKEELKALLIKLQYELKTF